MQPATDYQNNPLTVQRVRQATQENIDAHAETWADGQAEAQGGFELTEINVEDQASERRATAVKEIAGLAQAVSTEVSNEVASSVKNLQTCIELVFTYLQVYANTFSLGVDWPIEWSGFCKIVFIPFSLEFQLVVPDVDPAVRDYCRLFLVALVVPLIYYIFGRLWARPLEWKDRYVTSWTKTKSTWLIRGAFELFAYAVFGAVSYQVSAVFDNKPLFGVMVTVFALLTFRLAVGVLYVAMVFLARVAYSGNPHFSFFLDMRLRLKKTAIFLFLIVYFPVANELLSHLATADTDDGGAGEAAGVAPKTAGVQAVSAVLFVAYTVAAPAFLFRAMQQQHLRSVAATATERRMSTAAIKEQNIASPLELALRVQQTDQVLRELRRKRSRGVLVADSERVARVRRRLAELQGEQAEAMEHHEADHMWMPGNGAPLQSLWGAYEVVTRSVLAATGC